MLSFWNELPKPFFVLAPLADVTDPALRRLVSEYGKPDVLWTEFVSADGLYHTREKKGMKDEENPLMRDLLFTPGEHPIVAQLFTANPEHMAYAANLCKELGFDGVDINMGCPDKAIERQGCGAGMIKHPDIARAVIRAAKTSGLPVSVKTRIGYNTETMDEWLRVILEEDVVALTVHLRTRKEMSKVPAHWELAKRAVAIRDTVAPQTLILGNGDVKDLADAREKAAESGMDGIMFGRAIFGNPWLFTDRDTDTITPREKLEALEKLALYFSEIVPAKSFHLLKKHVKVYVSGWPACAGRDGASETRAALMDAADMDAFRKVLSEAKDAA